MFSSNTSQVSNDANYIEDVFSTWLYAGTGASQTITNGIDLAGEGGLVWIKQRNQATSHRLFDTARGVQNSLASNSTAGTASFSGYLTAFNSNGFSVGSANDVNESGFPLASWTFRKQPKFYTQGTFTGDGTTNKVITHDLNGTTGFIIVKRTDSTGNWQCWHRTFTNKQTIFLNTTDAKQTYPGADDITVTDTSFTVGTNQIFGNGSGFTYVYYVFAHNAGGFGLTGKDNVISCGSFTTDGGGAYSVTLGYEPQLVLIKRTDGVSDWLLMDNMRGMPVGGNDAILRPNSSAAETQTFDCANPTATGFYESTGSLGLNRTFIYIAIRRGPMKVPTDATKVFAPVTYTATSSSSTVTNSGFPVDANIGTVLNAAGYYRLLAPRLTSKVMATDDSSSESAFSQSVSFALQNGVVWSGVGSTKNAISYQFRRAPSFFDVACFTKTSYPQNVSHNLAAIPEMVIVKGRNSDNTTVDSNWCVWTTGSGNGEITFFNSTLAKGGYGVISAPTNTTTVSLSLDSANSTNFVMYLFATAAGVSKVGSYTGTGTTLQINCGFTAGSRFVLIKRTDSTGSWYVWDVARGISSGNDPYLLLNSTAAEVTNTDYIDAYSAGFEISSTAPAEINASGGTFIYLSIA